MTVKLLKSISQFAMVMIILSIIPSGAFASEDATLINSTDPLYASGSYPSSPEEDISEENFTEDQTELDSISKRITELQNFYSEISKVSNISDLQKVLSSDRQVNDGMNPDRRHIAPDEMQKEPDGKHGFCSALLEKITEENFTDFQAIVLDSLQNITEKFEAEQTMLTEAGESNRAKELNEKITEIKSLYTEASEASTAAELKEVLFTHEQVNVLDSIKKKLSSLKP